MIKEYVPRAKLTDDKIKSAFEPYLQGEENLKYWGFRVKQPNIFFIVLLLAIFILPGIIAVFWRTKNYLYGLTDNNLLVLVVASISNANVKKHTQYSLSKLRGKVTASTGVLFTKIKIDDSAKPFEAKFHRAFSKNNRPHAMAISEAITTGS
ncbi:MAG: hypothetical protein IH852_17770 [Bacteroidetes bacterium]|nr:hypothetical protein [Bacteroidota bacterium]